MTLDDLFSQVGLEEDTTIASQDLKGIKIKIASPEKIREWSYGEVKSQKLSTIVLSNQKEMVFFVLRFLAL